MLISGTPLSLEMTKLDRRVVEDLRKRPRHAKIDRIKNSRDVRILEMELCVCKSSSEMKVITQSNCRTSSESDVSLTFTSLFRLPCYCCAGFGGSILIRDT